VTTVVNGVDQAPAIYPASTIVGGLSIWFVSPTSIAKPYLEGGSLLPYRQSAFPRLVESGEVVRINIKTKWVRLLADGTTEEDAGDPIAAGEVVVVRGAPSYLSGDRYANRYFSGSLLSGRGITPVNFTKGCSAVFVDLIPPSVVRYYVMVTRNSDGDLLGLFTYTRAEYPRWAKHCVPYGPGDELVHWETAQSTPGARPYDSEASHFYIYSTSISSSVPIVVGTYRDLSSPVVTLLAETIEGGIETLPVNGGAEGVYQSESSSRAVYPEALTHIDNKMNRPNSRSVQLGSANTYSLTFDHLWPEDEALALSLSHVSAGLLVMPNASRRLAVNVNLRASIDYARGPANLNEFTGQATEANRSPLAN
jgi:hypothetical protein